MVLIKILKELKLKLLRRTQHDNVHNLVFICNQNDNRDTDVDSAGVGFGTKLSYQGFSVVASGFYGNALGIRGQHSVQLVLVVAGSTGALDDVGTERKSYGGYLQGTYDFGQGTSAGYSYGGNCLKRTGNDIQTRGVMNCQTMHSGMIWHNVTDNFRLSC